MISRWQSTSPVLHVTPVMLRSARLLLSCALVAATLAAAPCGAGASCLTVRKMDCCRTRAGITNPRCCDGSAQLSRATGPATTERPSSRLDAAPALDVGVVVTVARPVTPLVMRARDIGRDPPGGPLLAQSTSLLL